MISKQSSRNLTMAGFISLALNGCYFHPPFNNYKPYNNTINHAAVGAGVGAVVGGAVGFAGIGAGIGATTLAARSLFKEAQTHVIHDLQKRDIQVEKYGDTMTVIVPTDRYYKFNTPRLNELCYPGLLLIVKLLKFYPDSVIYVAGFTDNVGSKAHKKRISQAQAEAMVSFLWANGISSSRLSAEGYGDKNDIADNTIIHGSAQNRRIEIQWLYNPPVRRYAQVMPYLGPTK